MYTTYLLGFLMALAVLAFNLVFLSRKNHIYGYAA
jgi:hypothetical protein